MRHARSSRSDDDDLLDRALRVRVQEIVDAQECGVQVRHFGRRSKDGMGLRSASASLRSIDGGRNGPVDERTALTSSCGPGWDDA